MTVVDQLTVQMHGHKSVLYGNAENENAERTTWLCFLEAAGYIRFQSNCLTVQNFLSHFVHTTLFYSVLVLAVLVSAKSRPG